MRPDPTTKPSQQFSTPNEAELTWARELLKDVLCGCILNMKLKRAGLCPKFFCEMADEDFRQYGEILEALLFKRQT
jgi:hypothetical protein